MVKRTILDGNLSDRKGQLSEDQPIERYDDSETTPESTDENGNNVAQTQGIPELFVATLVPVQEVLDLVSVIF